jgi:hypothetical protein
VIIIKVIAGDLHKGTQRLDLKWVKSAELQTEDKLKKLAGSAGWGFTGAVVGGLLTGGIGLAIGGLAGILSGGNKTEVCFSCELEDSRKFLAITDKKTWQKLFAFLFDKNQSQSTETKINSELIHQDHTEKELDKFKTFGQRENPQNSSLMLDSEIHEVRQLLNLTLSEYNVTVQANQVGKPG